MASRSVRLAALGCAALAAVLGAAGATHAQSNDLAALSDEFDGGNLDGWLWHHDVEGWTNKLKVVEPSRAGRLHLQPFPTVWFFDYAAPFLFKDVTGDFTITTRVDVARAGGATPATLYSLAGLMVRAPKPNAPFTADSAWQKDRENYVFIVTGTTGEPNIPYIETKSAVRSRPLVKHYRITEEGDIELRIARVGRTFIALWRVPGGEWQVHERWFRPDMPATLQVGLMAYGDFDTIDRRYWYRPWEYNTSVIRDGVEDMTADFDFARFARLHVSQEAEHARAQLGVDWDDHRITNERLVALLPGLVQ